MARLDTYLETLLMKKAMQDLDPGNAAFQVDPDMMVSIGIDFSGNIDELKAIGLEVHTVSGSIYAGRIKLANLEQLTKHPGVVSVNEQRASSTHLHSSIPDIMANNVWARNGDNFTGYTGSGVIIGIIDSGIDFRHPNFIKPDGSTRILKIWDQTIFAPIKSPLPGETPPAAIVAPADPSLRAPLGYGVEYLRTQITNTIANPAIAQPCRHEDIDGHGTHVAGIAAGNGKQVGGCNGEHYYIGVAPDADIIAVRLWGLSKGDRGEKLNPPVTTVAAPSADLVLDAMKYILAAARAANKAAVINCSFGFFSESMDGTRSQCQAINNLINANSAGHAIVFSSGNEGASSFHAAPTIPAASPGYELQFKVFSDDTKERNLAITYAGSNLEVQVISPVTGANGTVAWVPLNNAAPVGTSATANGTIAGGTPGSVVVTNRPNSIGIKITPPKNPPVGTNPAVSGNNVANTGDNPWKIQIRNTTAVATPIHAYCIGGSTHDENSIKFINNTSITSDTTLNTYATATEVISVGSYKVGGQLDASSGRGPALYPPPVAPATAPLQKPDLCAPGVGIQSAAAALYRNDDGDDCIKNCCCLCCQDWYVGLDGTSMSAPHVTGAVALMLHKNNTLTHTQIKTRLRDACNGRPPDTPAPDLVGWGAGKLSALNAVSPVPQVNPPVTFSAPLQDAQPPLMEAFLGTEYGEGYYQLGQKYFREVLQLINTNKRVATAWHRIKGPVWTRMAITAVHNPDTPIPPKAHNISFKESFQQFAASVKQFASKELLIDIERFEPLMHLFQQEMKLRDLVVLLGNQPIPEKEAAAHY